MSEQKIVSWEELESLKDVGVETVHCPETSKALGVDVYVKVRGINATDLFTAYNFPLDEVNQMAADGANEDQFANALKEHAKTFTEEDLMSTMFSAVAAGLVEPKASEGDVKKLGRDIVMLFKKVMDLTAPKADAEDRARFRTDG